MGGRMLKLAAKAEHIRSHRDAISKKEVTKGVETINRAYLVKEPDRSSY